jgi:hypothetical protein
MFVQMLEILEQLDVGFEPHPDAIGGRHRAGLGRPGVASWPRRAAARLVDHLGRRRHDELTGRAVDYHRRPGGDANRRVVETDDGRHLQRSRKDRGVIRPAAGVGGKRLHPRPIELRRDRRRQLVGDQHRGPIELAEQLARAACAMPQVHAQAPGHVGHVVLALPQVRIFHRAEQLVQLLVGAMHGPRGVDALGADDMLGAADQHLVVKHQQLRVE